MMDCLQIIIVLIKSRLTCRYIFCLGDVYNIAWSGHNSKWLLAGTAAGLVGWKVGYLFYQFYRRHKGNPY